MAETVGIQVNNLDKVTDYLRQIGESSTAVDGALIEFGKITQQEAVRLSGPRRSGTLHGAITSTYYGGAGGVAIKVDTAKAPHGYTFHATKLGKARGYMTMKVPTHTRRGAQVSAYGRVVKVPDRPFLFLAFAAKLKELHTLVEEALTKVVND